MFGFSILDFSGEIFALSEISMIRGKEGKSEQASGFLLPGTNRDSSPSGLLAST